MARNFPAFACALVVLAAMALPAARADSGLTYNIAFFSDKACKTKGVTGDAWAPSKCYPLVNYQQATSAALTACTNGISDSCSAGLLISAGVKLTEDTPGKQVTISGYVSTTAGNYAACTAANAVFAAANVACSACAACSTASNCFTISNPSICCPAACTSATCRSAPSYSCASANTAGESCNDAVPSCTSGSCSYGGATKLTLANGLATDTCAALSDQTCTQTGICSVMIKSGLSAGAIVGVIIGVLVLGALVGSGYCFHRKTGPFAAGATWLGYLSCGRFGATALTPAKMVAAPDATVTKNSIVVRSVVASEEAAAASI